MNPFKPIVAVVIAVLIILLYTNQRELKTQLDDNLRLKEDSTNLSEDLFYSNRVIDSLKNVIFRAKNQ